MREGFHLAPHEWAQLRALLDHALALPVDARHHWLETLDPALAAYKTRLRALLAHEVDDTVARRLDGLPQLETGNGTPVPGSIPAASDDASVGPYRLLRELGSGGMATVWLAERTDMLQRRQVALKLPHGAWRRAGLAERMAREREILATLQHPHIAMLYDAGLAEDGQPYLALEFVEGERIDRHCERLGLDVRARLRLFLQVARAVAHAHAQLGVHRDLKPSNILVTRTGDAKLLDFGIAKLLDHSSTEETDLTRMSGRALTPEYAAPEQILGRPIGVPADVYALGVVLFELLTGVRPYALARDTRGALEDAIVQTDVPRPSRVAPSSRRKALRGDVDTIVLKALQKDPAQRYATADAFAEDLRRHLEHRPVLAQPDRAAYRLARFVRRNALAVGATTAVVAALILGTGVATWQAVQARAEQRRAEAVKTFVTSLFSDADPFSTASREPTVEGLLQAAQARLEAQPATGGALRVELLETIGSALAGLGRNRQAMQVLHQSIAEGTRSLGANHRLTLRARVALSSAYRHAGQTAEMRAELDDLLPRLRASADTMREELIDAVKNGAHLAIDEGRVTDAQAAAKEALAMSVRWLGANHRETADAALLVASADFFGNDVQQLLASAARAVEAVSRAYPQDPPHAKVLDAQFIHGRALARAGRLAEAVAALQLVLDQVRKHLGPQAPMAGYVAADIANFELERGHADTSLPHARFALSVLERVAQADSYTVAMAHFHVGRAELALYQAADARLNLERARPGLVAVRGERSAMVAELTVMHALALALLGRLDEAQREADAALEQAGTMSPAQKVRLLNIAGTVRRLQGAPDAAFARQEEALSALTPDTLHSERGARVRAELARLWLERGDPAKAMALLPDLAGAEPRAADSAQERLTRGRALLALKRPVEALPPLAQAAAFWHKHGAGSPWEREAAAWHRQAVAAATATATATAPVTKTP
jgi:eukaryotic-like serine/threonine-protein kinase